MPRFLSFLLLLLLALPTFAQEEPAPMGQALPQDPALLHRMREDLNHQLRNVQQMLAFVPPGDTLTAEALQERQAELSQRLLAVMQQLQGASATLPNALDGSPPLGRNATIIPGVLPGMPPSAQVPAQWGTSTPSGIPVDPSHLSGLRMPDPMPQMPYNVFQQTAPFPMPQTVPYNNPGIPPHWADQNPAWGAASTESSLPKELTEVKQTVESLRKEVAELKETIKTLETQIQLLNRNILLSERARENGM